MRAGQMRALTSGERAMAADIFARRLALDSLNVFQAPRLPFAAMVPLGKTIVFSRWRAAHDFSRADIHEQGWFIHELVHCWQARAGAVLPLAKLKAVGRRAYDYDLAAGKPFVAYNIEQQAEIVRHMFLARKGAPQAGAPPLIALQKMWAAAQ
jgi:hypothetical protein